MYSHHAAAACAAARSCNSLTYDGSYPALRVACGPPSDLARQLYPLFHYLAASACHTLTHNYASASILPVKLYLAFLSK